MVSLRSAFGVQVDMRSNAELKRTWEYRHHRQAYGLERISLGLRSLGFVRRSGDAVSKLYWAGYCAERFEAFTRAKDRHIAIVEQAPEY